MEFKGFRVLEAAILFTHLVRDLKLPSSSLKRQLVRSSESTALLLAEGEGRESWPDKKLFLPRRALRTAKLKPDFVSAEFEMKKSSIYPTTSERGLTNLLSGGRKVCCKPSGNLRFPEGARMS